MTFDSATYLGTWEPGSDDWHAARTGRIGGSEVAALLGLSPFESRYSLWHRKAGVIGPVPESPEMEWGKRLERAVLAKFADEHGAGVSFDMLPVNPTEPTLLTGCGTWQSRFRPFAVANPDGLLWTGGVTEPPSSAPSPSVAALASAAAGGAWEVVEAKVAMWSDNWGPSDSTDPDAVPVHYRIQTMWYLGVLGLSAGWVCVLIGGFDWRQYRIEFDAAEFATLIDHAAAFVDDVDAGIAPELDGHVATYEAVKAQHPNIVPDSVELTDEAAAAFVIAQAALKQCEANERLARSVVADEMGDAKRGTWCGFNLASRQARNGGTPYVVAGRKLPPLDLVLPAEQQPDHVDPFDATDTEPNNQQENQPA